MRTIRRAALAASCGAALAVAMAGLAEAESLGDAISLAYETNPTLQAERAQLRATDEEYPQAESGLRPTVSANGSYNWQDQTISTTGSPNGQTTGPAGQAAVQVTQPIYTGGLVTSRIDAAKADILAERENLRRVEIGVLQTVIGAYLDVRRDAEQLAISRDNETDLARQLDETRARFDAGELTKTDVAQSEARLAQAKSQTATALATLAEARAAYFAAVGQNPGQLAPEPSLDGLLPASVDAAFDAAERANPQLRQADLLEQASAARLAEAKSQTRPTVSVSGQYGYRSSQLGLVTGLGGSPGVLESEHGVTVTANVTAPIFTGGLYLSQIRQAAEQEAVSRIGIETARRNVLEAVAQSWNQLLGARAALTADEEQVASNTTALEGVTAEEKVGLRTILDVLNAQQELETSQLALVGARHDAYVAAAAVLAATGALDARDFSPSEPLYDPRANFDKARHALGWVPWESAVGAVDRIGAPSTAPRPPPPGPTPVRPSGD